MTATQTPAQPKLTLFTVMSPWHPNDPEQGTFEESVWAENHSDAERELAARMAASSNGCPDDENVDEWIEDHLENCRHLMVTVDALASVQSTLHDLLAGPNGEFDEAAQADLNIILAILKKRATA